MDDITTEQAGGVDRRTMLRRAAMGGAFVFATPVVQTIGMSVAAANTGFQTTGCPTPDGGECKPSRLVFTYTPDICGGSNCSPPEGGGPGPVYDPPCADAEGAMTACTGAAPGTGATLSARVTNPSEQILYTNKSVADFPDGEIEFDSGGCGSSPKQGLHANIEVTITSSTGTQVIDFHTSCSAPLIVGHRYGSLTFVGGVFDCCPNPD